jgi:hypothetical protein
MKHGDFHVGLEFVGSGGFWWRCTDVGTRTVVAIHLVELVPGLEIAQLGIGQHPPCPSSALNTMSEKLVKIPLLIFKNNGLQ